MQITYMKTSLEISPVKKDYVLVNTFIDSHFNYAALV